ncbi:MAG: hypothetical protein M3Z26_07000 [Bacteroidota bacterium]|nr:hypothetical protein [Bacteroidota bacterium]
MKKVTMMFLLLFAIFTAGTAQTTTPTQSGTTTGNAQTDKSAMAAQKKADREARKLAKQQQKDKNAATNVQSSTGLNKNGTPDKRLKANRQPKVQSQSQASTQSQAPVPANTQATQMKPQTGHSSANNTDKVVSTDAKGRTIYEGSRGGHYYITKNGNKEYIKK